METNDMIARNHRNATATEKQLMNLFKPSCFLPLRLLRIVVTFVPVLKFNTGMGYLLCIAFFLMGVDKDGASSTDDERLIRLARWKHPSPNLLLGSKE
jgi:hypothetical protein